MAWGKFDSHGSLKFVWSQISLVFQWNIRNKNGEDESSVFKDPKTPTYAPPWKYFNLNSRCIGDYRETHCIRCGKHYWAGSEGKFKCGYCGFRGIRNDEGEVVERDSDDELTPDTDDEMMILLPILQRRIDAGERFDFGNLDDFDDDDDE